MTGHGLGYVRAKNSCIDTKARRPGQGEFRHIGNLLPLELWANN